MNVRHILKIIKHWWKKQKNLNEWKGVPCSWIGWLHIVNMAIPPPPIWSSDSTQSLSESQLPFLTSITISTTLKIDQEILGTQKSQNDLEKQQRWRLITSRFQNLIQSYKESRQCGVGMTDLQSSGIWWRAQRWALILTVGWFWTRVTRQVNGERTVFQHTMQGYSHAHNELGFLSYYTQKSTLNGHRPRRVS